MSAMRVAMQFLHLSFGPWMHSKHCVQGFSLKTFSLYGSMTIPSMKWKIEPMMSILIHYHENNSKWVGKLRKKRTFMSRSHTQQILFDSFIIEFIEVMHYYPMFPLAPTYLYPALNPHLHAELTAIRHGHLIREQAELEYLSRSNLQLAELQRAKQYSNQVLEKELRIARLLQNDRTQLMLERKLLEERSLEQEMRFREEARRLDLERKYMLAKQGRSYQTERKKEVQNEPMRQTLKDPINSMSEVNKETAKFNSLQNGGEILNFKPKDYYVPAPNNQTSQTSNDMCSKRRHVKSLAKEITYREDESNLESSNTKRRSSILKNSNAKSPKMAKSKKQVQFLHESSNRRANSHTQSFQNNPNQSYCLRNSALRAVYGSSRKNPRGPASKRIENRLKVSTVVYRDSQFRNIKHEVDHLANTYDTECRLRRDLKGKINGKDEIIRKYNLVPPENK